MITIFTMLDAFIGPRAAIQRNSVQSWLEFPVDVLLLGEREPGASDFAREMGLPIYPVERNEFGTPLLGSILDQGERYCSDVPCFINADIILVGGLLESLAAARREFDKFFLSSPRYGLRLQEWVEPVDGWKEELWARAVKKSKPLTQGIDLFCYDGFRYAPHEPGYVYARTRWDNWFPHYAVQNNIPFLWGDIRLIHHNYDDKHRRDVKEMKTNKEVRGGGVGFKRYTYKLEENEWKPRRKC